MFVAQGRVLLSPSDLRQAARCEFSLIRQLDAVLGRHDRGVDEDDPVLARVAELGTSHEQAELRRLRARHPGPRAVVSLDRPAYDVASLQRAMSGTLALLEDPEVDVVYQATVFDGQLVGHVDFLERTPTGWLVSDTKLARSASVEALLQVGAYAAQLSDAGADLAPVGRLVLGSGVERDYSLREVVPVFRNRFARLRDLVAEHESDPGPGEWGDPRWLACGRCPDCTVEAEAARDLLLVAGMRGPTRRKLRDAGVRTIEDLALRAEPVTDVRGSTLDRLRAQAAIQLRGEAAPDGEVVAEVTAPDVLDALPAVSPGDVFFDFEGDPLWVEPGSDVWGLEYLFGVVEVDTGEPVFRAFLAHDRDEERTALVDFLGWLRERRRRWPDLHVYHYAAYETAALLRLAARHGVGEDEVDQLLREGVFVDLYAVVRSAIRVSQRSYSIKKLEPLYMPAREGAVTAAAESIVVYHQFVAASIDGRVDEAARLLAEIAAYNRDDCISTWRLRNWLLAQRDSDARPATRTGEPSEAPAVSPRRRTLLDLEGALRDGLTRVSPADRTPEQQAVALTASSLLFQAREDKPVWQAHFERLRTPVRDWRGEDGVFVVAEVELVTDWHRDTPRQRPRRTLRLRGEPMKGVPVRPGVEVSAVYATPAPEGMVVEPGHLNARSPAGVSVLEAQDDVAPNGRLHQVIVVEELMPKDGDEHTAYPVALVPTKVLRTDRIDDALADLAREVLQAQPELPLRAGTDLLARRPPRMRDGGPLPPVGDGADRHVLAIEAALRGMDDSYVAVQGPPGTGKTWVGAHVIARLVSEGWRVGVTSQGHAAIEHLLSAVVAAGVPAAQVGKAARATEDPPWTDLGEADGLAAFATGQSAGYVVGGTAWDLTHPGRVGRGQLDLLVVDEAGQYSLARTLACSVAADRLLLLGDPQQLPQVSTGTHPDPVDESALGWLLGAQSVLPSELGYFLETTWRMHPTLTEVVSRLSYAGRLSSAPLTADRHLEGVSPGLHVRLVDHHDRSTYAPEEAEEVLALVRALLGRTWEDPDRGVRRPLAEPDILVIAPYNAQVGTVRAALDAAGLTDVRVGTVDLFQGQEGAVAILTMAASSHTDVSRGMGFLLDRHRINVAISRARYAAYLVRSRVLTDFGPRTPDELVALGAFLDLCSRAVD